MLLLSSLFIAFTAIAGSLAAPANLVNDGTVKPGVSNLVLDTNDTLSRRSAINFDQDYTTGGTVSYYPSSTGFEVTWDTEDDFVVGVGWNPGSDM
jgi:endo-1,4-beta-xylanase